MASLQTSLFLAEQFRHVRLIEIPDELLDIIAREEKLFFKSPPSVPASGTINKPSHLHLCSNERSWLVKQVSTSNSLYITQTQATNPANGHNGTLRDASITGEDGDSIMADDMNQEGFSTTSTTLRPASTRLTAISKPTNVLELHAISSKAQQDTINEYIDLLIPRLNSSRYLDIDSNSLSNTSIPPSSHSCADLLDHIPAPSATVKKILAQQCIGDHWNRKAYQPTPALLLETWKHFVTAAISNSMDINDLLLGNVEDAFDDDGNGLPSSIYLSIASMWKLQDGMLAKIGLLVSTAASQREMKESFVFNPQETARWVGNLILQVANEENVEFTKASFEAQWEDAVPAAWVKFCSVEVLLPACVIGKAQNVIGDENEQDIVRWRPFQHSGDTNAQVGTGPATQSGKEETPSTKNTGGKSKRKWHEKFAAQRNAKK